MSLILSHYQLNFRILLLLSLMASLSTVLSDFLALNSRKRGKSISEHPFQHPLLQKEYVQWKILGLIDTMKTPLLIWLIRQTLLSACLSEIATCSLLSELSLHFAFQETQFWLKLLSLFWKHGKGWSSWVELALQSYIDPATFSVKFSNCQSPAL